MKGIYVDDQPADVQALVKKLSVEGLDIVVVPPEENMLSLADKIIDARPSFVILDYRLDEYAIDAESPAVGYRAAPLAQQLRDRLDRPNVIDFPIVLISSEEKIRKLFRPEKTAHDLFDWKLIKPKVAKQDDSSRVLAGLAKGYQSLQAADGKYGGVSLFGLDAGFEYLIDWQELKVALEEAEYPHIVARYLINFVVRRQGLLIDRDNLYAVLGLATPDEQAQAAIYAWLAASKYSGVFSECRNLWWSELVDALFREQFSLAPNKLTALERCEELKKYLGVDISPAKDPWTSGSSYKPSFACACCKQPTSLGHSLACFDSRLPSFVRRLRICYRCVQKDRIQEDRSSHDDDYPLQVDGGDEVIARRLRSGELRPEVA
ncbi:hypothetical protein [Stenotrophomonas sp. Iso1]|uniref:hypothetical protein n=1 Tax=Stenotrophomonas sp. Iso1 TaxID=2977283 RepID=UPI0022B787F4|nr:hypothetical protein [Stenotrophomonas sp. Iso1]